MSNAAKDKDANYKEASLWARLSKTTALATLALAAATPAFAQNADQPVETAARSSAAGHGEISPTRLLELMVRRGLVSRQEADALLAEAAQTPAPQPQIIAQSTEPGVQTVPYIPETVRNQIRNEVRDEVMTRARSEGWAAPGSMPEWTKRITFSGDIRARAEGVMFPDGDFGSPDGNFDSFPDFNAINDGHPFDINGDQNDTRNLPPLINTTQDRTRARIRARLGLTARIDDNVSADLRIATGSDASPVSTNQTLGSNGDGKTELWLDRAAIHFNPLSNVTVDVGRFANPFWTSELVFDSDMNFDGVALRGRQALGGGLIAFGTLGAFPIFNTSFDFGSREIVGAYESHDRYLTALQAGLEWGHGDDVRLTGALGYFNFSNVAGELSSICYEDQDVCSTDNTRALWVQGGNSLTPIRYIVERDPIDGDYPSPQYFGLASDFEVLDLRAALEFPSLPIPLRFDADYAVNLAFDENRVQDLFYAGTSFGGGYDPGNQAWALNVMAGKSDLAALGDWNVQVGYRYLETDAVLDAFTDSDFHLGGTNAEGFTLGAGFGLARNTYISGRWLSANEVTGAPYAVDIFQLDLATRF